MLYRHGNSPCVDYILVHKIRDRLLVVAVQQSLSKLTYNKQATLTNSRSPKYYAHSYITDLVYLTAPLNHNRPRLRLCLKFSSCRTDKAFVKPSAI